MMICEDVVRSMMPNEVKWKSKLQERNQEFSDAEAIARHGCRLAASFQHGHTPDRN